ncbi:TPA: hypothetical protein JZF11_004368 [Escherichia coli]|nr:hypothetical protein [Escherichia coli]HAX4584491.1 hypothetical protein [Escherichia coli]
MSTKFYTLLTDIGAAKLASAAALGVPLKITHMAVGDGSGVLPTPDAKQTALVNEKRRAALNMLYIDPQNSSQIIAEQVIPENEGGWWIREVGLFDESGALIAVGNCPESYKPQLAEGSGRTQTVRMVLITSSTDNITLKIDPAVVLATRKYVDDKALELKVYADDQMAKHLAAPDPHSQYAPKASPTFTGTPKAPTPAAGNNTTQVATTAFVQAALTALINGAPATLDTLKEIAAAINNDPNFSTTINNALALKAPLSSPALTGTPTAPTAAQSVNNTQIATTAFVKSAIAGMVGSAPAALDTLNELAAALGNDPNFATTMLNALAGKQPLDNTLTNLSGKDVAGLLTYLGLGEAAKRDVGTGDNQIPDMGAFASGSGWFRLPGGYIVQFEKLEEIFHSSMFNYQRHWWEAGKTNRIRNLLKSRQIGATFYFAREALIDALLTGRNQIFLSASKAQAHVFKQYIIDFAKEVEVELKGDPMVLPNGATLYFLGTNARTAQSYHGNLYLDEYFWIPKFQELRKVASGMAIHKKWRQTYFSTPSSLTHSAYPFWSGALFNRGRNKADKVDIDLSHSNLAPGLLCADGQYRQIVTVEDAVRGGCNLFDLDQLRMEYSPDEYQNLLMCEFVDDLASVFPLSELQACMVDSWEVWTDFHALALRPFGWREVWIGYDPAKGTQNGDSAGCVVVAPPAVPGGKFRILERHQWRGMDFRAQADAIKKLTEQYNVTYIGIDSTGVGHGVYENVKAFFPAVREFVYNPNVKNALVLKAYDIISHRRLEFDAGHTDIAQSFMAIRRATTASGNRPTYEASRSEEASHADLAWATMHALFNEPLQGESANTSNIVEIF